MSKKKETEKTKEFNTEELDKIEERNDEELEKGNPTREELENKIEEITEEETKNKKLSITLIILLVVLLLACIFLIVYLVFIRKPKEPENPVVDNITIERPSEDFEYTIIKQNSISFECKKTKDGEKFKELKKGLIIDCEFKYETSQKISELYFDLGNSSNIKLKEYANNSDYTVETDNTTYKISTNSPSQSFVGSLHFYYQVTNATEKTGYLEVKNIVFKDENDTYYKMINNMVTFPPEYNDKIYIYKVTYQDEDYTDIYYYSSKYLYTKDNTDEDEEYGELVDTFQCNNETCDEKGGYNNYFIIYDDKLILYNTLNKTTKTINTDENFDPDLYTYEVMVTEDENVYGIAFKKNYVSDMDCESNEFACIERSISGYEIGYYSFDKDMFTITLDYGFVGASAYDDYDRLLMLKKDNKFGLFSYETDSMLIEMTSKYSALQQDNSLHAIKMELYDKENKQNYYTYYNYNNNSFKLNIADLNKFNNSSDLYYLTEYNKQNNLIAMLFDGKGEQLTNLPYVLYKNIVSVSDKIIIKNNGLYDFYDLKGNKLFTSKYTNTSIIENTKSYVIALNNKNMIEIDDLDGNALKEVIEFSEDKIAIVRIDETDSVLKLYIQDLTITEGETNGYIYTYKNGTLDKEDAFIE